MNRGRRFISTYTNFKSEVNFARIKLKSECSKAELKEMIEIIEQCKTAYKSLRTLTAPLLDIRKKMDTCTSVTSEVIIVLEERQKESNQIFSLIAIEKSPSPSYCRGKMPAQFMAQLCPDSVEVVARSLKYSQRRRRQLRVWLLNRQEYTEKIKFLCSRSWKIKKIWRWLRQSTTLMLR